jgi:RND family efflux transporter MFP subunit
MPIPFLHHNPARFVWPRRFPYLLGFGMLALLLVAGCSQAPLAGPEKKAVEVVVTESIRGRVEDYQDFTGRLDGLRTVEIRARVSGFVMEAPFKEGDHVKEGDLLFQIDRRPYQAALNQAEANLKLAEADRNLQEKNVVRARQMVNSNSIGREEFDTMVATGEKARATVGATQAARDLAQLNLDYTHVIAPISGRVSRRFVDPGNLITADNTMLTTVVSDHQLYAYFDVDERTYLDLVGSPAPSQGSWFTHLQYPVLMRLANEDKFERSGFIDFIDNRVNANTGTVRMRGVFDNPKGVLKAGLFVRIRLPIGTPYEAVLIPDETLQSDQGRKYAYVVNGKNQVEYRTVTVGQEIGEWRVIKDGLSKGERVILSGQQRVRKGTEVQVKVKELPRPPESPLVKLIAKGHK